MNVGSTLYFYLVDRHLATQSLALYNSAQVVGGSQLRISTLAGVTAPHLLAPAAPHVKRVFGLHVGPHFPTAPRQALLVELVNYP